MLRQDIAMLEQVARDDKWTEQDRDVLDFANIALFLKTEYCMTLEKPTEDDIIGCVEADVITLGAIFENPYGQGSYFKVVEIDQANDRALLEFCVMNGK